MASDQRYKLSDKQLNEYFDRIALPTSKRTLSVQSLNSSQQLDYLKTLLKHQQTSVPFENLTLHYSWHRTIKPEPLHLFRKIVSDGHGRGGYCMEANLIFHTLLLSLGFNCYIGAARVWAFTSWTGWSHLVNFVIIDGVKYLCDVGFGPQEPTQPLRLVHGEVQPQIPPAESRLVYEKIPQNLSENKMWIYQIRFNANEDWTQRYCFTETEILPHDIEGLNWSPMRGLTSIFTQKVIVCRFSINTESPENVNGVPDQDQTNDGEIDGTIAIDDSKLTWRKNGETILQKQLGSEDERLEALKKYWGVDLDVEDREAILGTTTAIRGT
jgi:arylamine N-acetyltransferase